MSNKELRDLYGMVGRSRGDARTGVVRAYEMIYEEAEEEKKEEEDGVTIIYYATDEAAALELAALQQVNPQRILRRSMSDKYFKSNVKGRLDENMAKQVRTLVLVAFGKKEARELDPVAYRGIYDVYASNAVPGDAVEVFLDWRGKRDGPDSLIEEVKRINKFGVINAIPLLRDNLINSSFMEKSGLVEDQLNQFLNELWDIKDVQGRTSVGRGELVMCCFSRCHKGEPGDVVETTMDDKLTSGKLIVDNLKIEVKGSGGRPGKKGWSRDNFYGGIVDLLAGVRSQPVEEGVVSETVHTSMRSLFKKTTPDLVNEICTYLAGIGQVDKASVDVLRAHLELSEDITPLDEGWGDWINQWFDRAWTKNTNPAKLIYQQLSFPNTNPPARKASIGIMLAKQSELLTDATQIFNTKMPFKLSVETFFGQVLGQVRGNHPGAITDRQIAEAIWLTRTELHADEDTESIINHLERWVGRINFPQDYPKLVGAVQLTSYCNVDEFSHLMCVDDSVQGGNKAALIVKCTPENMPETFDNIFEAFLEKTITVPLSIDDQNKGVQIIFKA